jgi:hypothetical protein
MAGTPPAELRQHVEMGETEFCEVIDEIRRHVPGYGVTSNVLGL